MNHFERAMLTALVLGPVVAILGAMAAHYSQRKGLVENADKQLNASVKAVGITVVCAVAVAIEVIWVRLP